MTKDVGLGTVAAINMELTKLYERHWSALSSCIPRGEHYSAPLLLQVDERYARAEVRLMVVGQQTNTWWGKDGWDSLPAEAPIDHLLRCYVGFQLGKSYPGPFWSAAHSLAEKFGGERCGLIWSNLVRVDQARSKNVRDPRPVDIEDRLRTVPLLQGEIAILSPHVVVFFTGPSYDGLLAKTFPESVHEVGSLSRAKPVSRMIHAALPAKSFRTYHPNYLQRAGLHRSVLSQIVSLGGGVTPAGPHPE